MEPLSALIVFFLAAFGLQDDGNLVVLLENPDGTVGSVTVSNPAGAQTLTQARQGTAIASLAAAPETPVAVPEALIQEVFGEALRAQPQRPGSFLLYFPTGADTPTAESRPELDKALRDAATRRFPQVSVIGHTDRVGAADANYRLGFDRGAMVRDFLVQGGVPATAIDIRSHGEGDPLVRTPDETPEPRNRRVEIMVR